jgi:hypothetical protein
MFCETVTENCPSKATMYRSDSKGGLSMEAIAKEWESSNFPCYMSMGSTVLRQKKKTTENNFKNTFYLQL